MLPAKNNNQNNLGWIILLGAFALLPFGNERVQGILPLYTFDFILLTLFFLIVFQYSSQVFFQKKVVFGLVAFIAAVAASAVSYDFTLTTAGLIKSWFVFPIAAIGIFIQHNTKEGQQNILRVWFYGLTALLLLSVVWWIIEAVTFDNRLVGIFTSPNFLGYFLFPGTMLSLYMAKKATSYRKAIFLLAASLFLAVALQTQSLGALLAIIASLFFFQFSYIQECTRSAVGKVILLTALIWITPTALFFEDQLTEAFGERSSVVSRIMIWKSAWSVALEHPLLGIGPGNFQEAYLLAQPQFPLYLEWAVPEPHNIFLALWLASGVVGVSVFFWFIWLAFSSKDQSLERRALEALLLGTLVYGLFDTPFLGNALAFVGWCNLLALLLVVEKTKKTPSEEESFRIMEVQS